MSALRRAKVLAQLALRESSGQHLVIVLRKKMWLISERIGETTENRSGILTLYSRAGDIMRILEGKLGA